MSEAPGLVCLPACHIHKIYTSIQWSTTNKLVNCMYAFNISEIECVCIHSLKEWCGKAYAFTGYFTRIMSGAFNGSFKSVVNKIGKLISKLRCAVWMKKRPTHFGHLFMHRWKANKKRVFESFELEGARKKNTQQNHRFLSFFGSSSN